VARPVDSGRRDKAERASFALIDCAKRHAIGPTPCYRRTMALPDLNLLVTLDVLLTEGSVARAAKRLQLSPSAMSRALARLREVMGDPLLVRAGRGLVPTPRALELQQRVGDLVKDAEAVLRPAKLLDLKGLVRSFTLRNSDGFTESFGPHIVRRVNADAPGVQLRFMRKLDRGSEGLRDGSIDLETGVLGRTLGPEVRAKALFRDRFVGVVRAGHPFETGVITAARFAAGNHVRVSQRGMERGPIDEAVKAAGLRRNVVASVDGYIAALALARQSDLIASVPERHTCALRDGMFSFPFPVYVPEVTVSLLWHPRQDSDPAHQWLRQCVFDACKARLGDS
jgi:DNA-binding transcriptional LysR family regulator